jgi:hypothetical protein
MEHDRDDDSDIESDVAAARRSIERRAKFVEVSIQQAIRNGDFDDLPGAGKPIENLGGVHDPDWWIRRKIQRENLTGLGPAAFTLRTEDAAMDARLDAMVSEREVRDTLDDFNRRVIEARRQLLGGPPVVTPVRDIDAEVERWRERRRTRVSESAAHEARPAKLRRRGGPRRTP